MPDCSWRARIASEFTSASSGGSGLNASKGLRFTRSTRRLTNFWRWRSSSAATPSSGTNHSGVGKSRRCVGSRCLRRGSREPSHECRARARFPSARQVQSCEKARHAGTNSRTSPTSRRRIPEVTSYTPTVLSRDATASKRSSVENSSCCTKLGWGWRVCVSAAPSCSSLRAQLPLVCRRPRIARYSCHRLQLGNRRGCTRVLSTLRRPTP
mmetsp:Transcript_44739/g.103317  ORF Transcript_44739/g.103317 Transcript_44739/m.103317 type:complete len:211 (-) Transcript_44739:2144-2776(-)